LTISIFCRAEYYSRTNNVSPAVSEIKVIFTGDKEYQSSHHIQVVTLGKVS
jgi:hypothetical protein